MAELLWTLAGYLLAVLVVPMIGVIYCAPVGAFGVQVSMKLVVFYFPPYGMAYRAVFLGYVASVGIWAVMNFIDAALGHSLSPNLHVIAGVMAFFAEVLIYMRMLQDSSGQSIKLAHACMISVLPFALAMVVQEENNGVK